MSDPAGWPGNPVTYPDGYGALRVVPGIFRLLASSVLARTAGRTYSILLVLFVLSIHNSPGLSGLVVLASQIPGVLISPIAGALLDRRGRLALIRLDFFIASISISLIAVLNALHLLPIWALFAIVIASSLTQPLSATGTRSLFPLLVPRLLWDRANALDSSSFVVSNIFGPVIGGSALAIFGARYGLLVPVALFVAAGAVLFGVRAPDPVGGQEHVLRSAWDAVRYVFTNKALRQLSAIATVYIGCSGALNIIIPVLVIDHLHGGGTTAGVMLAVSGIGGSISSIVAGRLQVQGRELLLMRGSSFACGICLGLFALTMDNEALCFVLLFAVGLTTGPFNIVMFGVRQRVTHPDWFGRAFAISMSINGVGMPIGAALVGAAVSHSIALGFVLSGLGALAATGWSLLFPIEIADAEPTAVELLPLEGSSPPSPLPE